MARPIITQMGHMVIGIAPVADAFDGTKRTDVLNMKNYNGCTFLIYKGVGTTGTSTITVNACDDVTPSNRTAIPFKYRVNTGTDVWGAVTVATVTGFLTTAGSNHMYEIIVDGDELGDTGYGYIELTAIESVNDPVLGGVLWIGHDPKSPQDVPATVLT